jgi:hypothetical protein
MERLTSRQHQIPNGFKFFLPELNWSSPPFISFDSLVNQVVQVVRGNPHIAKQNNWPTEPSAIADWVESYQVAICKQNGWMQYLQPEIAPPKTTPPLQVSLSAGRLVAGAKTLLDWLGDGMRPVSRDLAEQRAQICSACAYNGKGDLSSWFTRPASELIRKQIGAAKDLNMRTSVDDKLGVCNVCACPIKLKVHVPRATINKHTAEMIEGLPAHCWMKTEQ